MMNFAYTENTNKILESAKFRDPDYTADGQDRAVVQLKGIDTLWFNTGTLCNLSCTHCYIESTPTNDRLAYLDVVEVSRFLDELDNDWQGREIGFTGGEPFLNKGIIQMMSDALARDYEVLVLTNAMKPMFHRKAELLALRTEYGSKLRIRVSLDHHSREDHDRERGTGSWDIALAGVKWLSDNGFHVSVAGRTMWQQSEAALRDGFAELFTQQNLRIDAFDPASLVLFPEMDETVTVPEITTACWQILGKRPDDVMCASARMVVRRKGDDRARVLACTLLAYHEEFQLGDDLKAAACDVKLNHPHCAKFCVLGGASCSVD
jgi:uncharacterized Fe-S cluster-containing radical SAM superfamily protein